MAQYAERGSAELHTLLFFKGKVVREEAYITRVKENGFVALIPKYDFVYHVNIVLIYLCRYGVEAPVFVSERKEDNPFVYDEKAHTLSYENVSISSFQWRNTTVTYLDNICSP